MHYLIHRRAISSQFIQVNLVIGVAKNERLSLQLPSWRPGRYELANYAQNIRTINAHQSDNSVPLKKITKDCWELNSSEDGEVVITYEYFCNQLDAGGCWSDDQQLYLNFSNFAFSISGRAQETITIALDIPENYKIACALTQKDNTLIANNYQELIDSPLIASSQLKDFSYEVGSTCFKIWILGGIHFQVDKFLRYLKEFSKTQIESFGEFPADTYHFMYHLLPYKHYHGVEHRFSTVITFGPDVSLKEEKQMHELIGVSSHELYHFWNVCRIRPVGISPYDLSKETYLKEGLVLEGITTYMGDLMLLKSGYFSLEQYLNELGKQIRKESESFGWRNQSILDSSLDLWLDGYKQGIPHKKVNIYNRGSLISFCLDVFLIEQGLSLQYIMRKLWENFRKTDKGYTWEEFLETLRENSKDKTGIAQLIEQLILGKNDIIPFLKESLLKLGLALSPSFADDPMCHQAGILLDSSHTITNIHPDSAAIHSFMLKDQLLDWKIDEASHSLVAKVLRYGRTLDVESALTKNQFFPTWGITIQGSTAIREKWMNIN